MFHHLVLLIGPVSFIVFKRENYTVGTLTWSQSLCTVLWDSQVPKRDAK